MYLKQLELVGFKSFAEKTKLEFEPGMTAIVGPNGCGKSNVSDAIRWVLGETSAKALRGGSMTDVIFNGTDTHKPLSLAEVSLTLADCEASLGTEFNEVRVTRRVLRSGEGQYFINKTPCRLKDIQRLFMDTGIGTNSYSVMEQGKIDQILSSRPDDRRAVFEEASGITKFKADRKEALRKLEHTEANLLRLEDIIREVKRQIISLQRQAGKARRYKTIQEELRGVDLFVARERLHELDQAIRQLENRRTSVGEQADALRADVDAMEQQAGESRAELARLEGEIAAAMDRVVEAQSECDRARQLIQINEDRIREMRALAERDSRDAEEAQRRLGEHQQSLAQTAAEAAEADKRRAERKASLDAAAARLQQLERQVEEVRNALNASRNESVSLDARISRLQNQLSDIDNQERSAVLKRERLAAEEAELERALRQFNQRREQMQSEVETHKAEAARREQVVAELSTRRQDRSTAIRDMENRIGEKQRELAGKQAQIQVLTRSLKAAEGFSSGAKFLLQDDKAASFRAQIIGPLADAVKADPGYDTALAAALRALLDAVVVKDAGAARDAISLLRQAGKGSARILAASAPARAPISSPEGPGERLLDHLHCTDELRSLLEVLLGSVRVVDSESSIPRELASGLVLISRDGAVVRADGVNEWWSPDSAGANPIARRHQLDKLAKESAAVESDMATLRQSLDHLRRENDEAGSALSQARTALDEQRRALNIQEGELRVVTAEAKQAGQRVETVRFELQALVAKANEGGDRRTAVAEEIEQVRSRLATARADINTRTDALREHEQHRSEALHEAADCRVSLHDAQQQVQQIETRRHALGARVQELESIIRDRSAGVSTYEEKIRLLEAERQTASDKIAPLEQKIAECSQALASSRERRTAAGQTLHACDERLRGMRDRLEELRSSKSAMDVEMAQQTMRRQNLMERVRSEYNQTEEEVLKAPEPVWETGERPARDALESQIAELRAKMEALGPVNLVAIEEHQELEERFAFLTQQQDDLVNAKQQLLEMIKKINQTTTELFSDTFNKVNTNFEETFKRLFGGGTAKLVMVDEEDVLESGIEIIARPPGKKLQTVSLLSGGERTMTAVALLFALFMVKPSPFCVLDELDAALDEANIKRFVEMVKAFVAESQFVVITHNRNTIEAANCLYGVTMQQRGVSKIVSVRLKSHHDRAGAQQAEDAVEVVPEEAAT